MNIISSLSLFVILLGLFSCQTHPPLETVPQVSLEKYAGKWYEISSIPIRAQRGCRCTFAEYGIHADGYVTVYNQCKTAEGKIKDISGKAFVETGSNNSKLKVQFFWPFKADYQIIALADDYSYAMVGSPSRKYLWILSRTNSMPEKLYESLLMDAENKGFDTALLVKTDHNCD